MNAIKITAANAAAIEAALKAVNGTAYQHAYTSFAEVEHLVEIANERLAALNLPKGMHKGAKLMKTSGAAVAKAYAKKSFNGRAATTVVIERRSSDWFMVAASKTTVHEGGGGKSSLFLTEAQDAEVIRRTRESYSVVKQAA